MEIQQAVFQRILELCDPSIAEFFDAPVFYHLEQEIQ